MSLPNWLTALPDAAQMRATDSWAITTRGVASLDLMERAGAGLAALTAELVPSGRIVVVCGGGNNGGDGIVAARLLRAAGREVDVLLTCPVEELSGDPGVNLSRLTGPPVAPWVSSAALEGAAGVIDAVLGTGFSGPPREPALGAIRAINGCSAVVVCADVPSGVDASTGEVAQEAVRATATATFHAAKPGLWIYPGKAHAGTVRVIEIGIPDGAPGDANAGLLNKTVLDLIPRRSSSSTKFSEGSLMVVGGSSGLTGAPLMVVAAAQRTGAGYVTAAVPQSLAPIFAARLLEAMSRVLPDAAGGFTPDGVAPLTRMAEEVDAVVLGPGIGRSNGASQFARGAASAVPAPMVLDADGLNAHAGRLELIADRDWPTVLTPHAGELARLLAITSAEVQAKRLAHVRAAAATADAVVLLKGDDTLIASPNGRVAISASGTPALATAGSGDVLSGVIGALLAKGMAPFAAACAGAVLHAEAGRIAGEEHGVDSVIASDVIAALGAARQR
ncbi:MAG: NAD(P)H-hydrate dehydratase [Actinomycetota bacterium]